MTIRYEEIGQRLRAYRLGKALTAEQVAERLGVSRAAIFRIEKGEVVKIETLERLAELLDVSVPSLLGVGVEYFGNAVAYFERMRQIEEKAVEVIAHFEPVSYLLTSDAYPHHLRTMLLEAIPAAAKAPNVEAEIDAIMDILAERKAAAVQRRLGIVSLIGAAEIERFLRIGLVGRFDLAPHVLLQRRRAAAEEVEHIAALMAREPIGVQIGVVEEPMPNQTFQIFRQPDATWLGVSPFRLGEQPNIRTGVAMVTAAPEAVELYQRMVEGLWRRAHKGREGAAFLRRLVQRASAARVAV